MTAQDFIDKTKPLLYGLKVVEDDAILLNFLNMAKNQLASDLLLWSDGDEISMTTDREYTLSKSPIQIMDVYDNKGNIRTRNSNDRYGYYQTSPSTITLNVPNDGDTLYVNYYIAPSDYLAGDTIDIPFALHNTVQWFMSYMAHSMYKGETYVSMANKMKSDYKGGVMEYIAKTDTLNTETLYEVNMISTKGFV